MDFMRAVRDYDVIIGTHRDCCGPHLSPSRRTALVVKRFYVTATLSHSARGA
jgi:hypothetical protein